MVGVILVRISFLYVYSSGS